MTNKQKTPTNKPMGETALCKKNKSDKIQRNINSRKKTYLNTQNYIIHILKKIRCKCPQIQQLHNIARTVTKNTKTLYN